jgi:hypothetical protein
MLMVAVNLVAALCNAASGPTDYIEKKSITTLNAGIWYQFTMTFDGSITNRTDRIQLHTNTIQGNLFSKVGAKGAAITNNSQEITVGSEHALGSPKTPNNQYNGAVDDIRI